MVRQPFRATGYDIQNSSQVGLGQGRLYLGATKEVPFPLCPFCEETDSVEHFGRSCEEVDLLAFLQSLWEHWFGHPFPEVWWTLEYSADWQSIARKG